MRIIVEPARRATRPLIEHAPEASYREFCQVYSFIVIQFDLGPIGHSFSNPFPYRLSSATALLCFFVPYCIPYCRIPTTMAVVHSDGTPPYPSTVITLGAKHTTFLLSLARDLSSIPLLTQLLGAWHLDQRLD
jgi:hypothetical protein